MSNAKWVEIGGDYNLKGRMHAQIQFYKPVWKIDASPEALV